MTASGASLRACTFALGLTAMLCMALPVSAQTPVTSGISAPTDGQTLQGQVPVRGTTDVPNFSSAEVAFAYTSDPTQTWFTIQTASLPVRGDVITIWDTTLITDGDYLLRLRVNRIDGSTQDTVETVHVRNYTPIPTATPAVTATQPAVVEVPTAIIILPTETPTAEPVAPAASPSPLPPNPAGITSSEIFSGFWRGALLVGVLVLVFAAIVRLRR